MIFKNLSSLVLQIIVVIAAVIVFAYFDPFNILAPQKQKLVNTPITVVSIREIGQLITAEYYGEVLSSLQETEITEIQVKAPQTRKEFDVLNKKYLIALLAFYHGKDTVRFGSFFGLFGKRADVLDYFYDNNHELVNNIFYQDMIALIVAKNKHSSEKDFLAAITRLKKPISPTENLPDEIVKEATVDTVAFKRLRNEQIAELQTTKAFRKKQIILLGRGTVRAGIDFGKFTERNFKYDKSQRTIYLLGVEPTILDCDINPWFLPKQKIKGFEIIAATDRAAKPDYLLKVKNDCLAKLRAQAEANGIVYQARVNAELTLKHFFSLLLNEPIDEVKIMENSIEAYNTFFPKGKTISKQRLPMLDSMLTAVARIDRDTALKKINELMHTQWNAEPLPQRASRYASLGYVMAQDRLLSRTEWAQLEAMVNKPVFTRTDSLWFFPYKEYPGILKEFRESKAYNGPMGLWKDSVTEDDRFKAYRTEYHTLARNKAYAIMLERRDTARGDLYKYLKGNVKTVVKGTDTFNGDTAVWGKLDSLSRHNPHSTK